MTVPFASSHGVQACAATILRLRWAIILFVCAITAVSGYGLRFLGFDPDTRVFFDMDNPERMVFEEMERTYRRANTLVFVVAPEDGRVFTRETLAAVDWLTERAWHIPYVTHVSSLTNQQRVRTLEDEIIVQPLIPAPADLDAQTIEDAAAATREREDLVGLLVSPTLDVTAVGMLVDIPRSNHEAIPRIARAARALADELRDRFPQVEVHLSGGAMADMAFGEAAERDLSTLLPAMLILIVVTLTVGLRSFPGMLIALAVVGSALLTTLGLAGWHGLLLNSASSAAPIAILALALADCVHISVSTHQRRQAGLPLYDAIIEALRINAVPVMITSLTTIVGFLTLNLSASPPFAQLGNLIALGMAIALIYSLTLLPALLTLLPPNGYGLGFALEKRLLRGLADSVIRHRHALLLAGTVGTVALGAGALRITLDDNFIRYFDDSYAFRADTDFMERHLTGVHVIQYSLPSGEAHGITRPEYLQAVDAFGEFLRSLDGIGHVTSVADLFKRLNMNLHPSMQGNDRAHYRLPEDHERAAQYLLVHDLSWPPEQSIGVGIDIEQSASLVTAMVPGASSAELRRLGAAGEAWLREHAPSLAAPATGLSMMFAHVSERNIRSMIVGTGLALALISLILVLALRSPVLGLVSLLPNLMPAIMAFGVWGWLYGEVNLAASVIGAITIGIVVDDTVHLLTRYLRGRRELGLSPADAIRHSIESVGTAVVLTSLALILGFSVLGFSGFAISHQMGILCATTIAIALLADLFILPPLLLAIDRRR
ncbi:MAG: MMPL family transporter [Chromatiales bacterium]|nr:MMPL family transporter [Chromatiales bacterium]